MQRVRGPRKSFIHTNFLGRQSVNRPRAGSRNLPLLTGSLGLIILVCFFACLWVRIYVLEVGYRISASLAQHEQLQQENRKLRIERASLASPARIESIAKNKLGMVVPDNSQVVILKW